MNTFDQLQLIPIADALPANALPISNIIPYTTEVVSGKSILILSDIHLPFHSGIALEAALRYGLKEHCDTVLINGDLLDAYQLSKFCKDFRQRSFADEIKFGRAFFLTLRKRFKHAEIIYKLGNHEERWERYVMDHPELIGLAELDPKNLLRLQDSGVRIVRDKRRIKLGKLTVLHGHEYGPGASSSVNPARGIFLRAKSSVLIGHCHRKSDHAENSIEDKQIVCVSTGCLCDLHPEYAPLNNWQHGFAVVRVHDSEGHYSVANKYISKEGIVY